MPMEGVRRRAGAADASPRTARSRFGLEPKDLVDENDGDAPRDDLAVDDQHLIHRAVDAVGELGAGILEQEGIVVDPAKAFLQRAHDLLRPYDQDAPPRAADLRTQLAAT